MFNSGESFNNANTEQSGEDERINRNRGNMVYQAAREQAHETSSHNERYKNMSTDELKKRYQELAMKHPEAAPTPAAETQPVEPEMTSEVPTEEQPFEPEAASDTSAEAQPAKPETVSEAKAAETKKHASKKPTFKKFIAGFLITTTVFALGTTVGASFADKEVPKTNTTAVEYDVNSNENQEKVAEAKDLTGIEVLDEKIDGSFEQDDNIGCYEDGDKVSPNSLGNPNAILEEMGVDPKDATPEQRGKITEYLSYSMKYPAAYNAIAYGISGFEDLTINEAEDKIGNMSAEEKEDLQNQLKEYYENSTYSTVTGQGVYKNQGVAEREDGRHSFYVESNLTGEEILRRETKLDDGSTVELFFRVPCAGNGLDQIVTKLKDGTTIAKTIREKTPTVTQKVQEETPKPQEELQPKNIAAEKKNAGPRVTPQKLDEKKTPKTSVKQDYKAVDKAHEQVKSGNIAGSETEKKKQEKVDNSAQTKKNNEEAKSNADNSAEERAKQFEEGDF